ncbi:MAG: hypothetical protein A2014_03205 [Spirochaetes bacterium GWF1_49_6]|nr:MAG: hypothetical protein A2014_03205 [Spirochaetes bacterium GWF1_49_6]
MNKCVWCGKPFDGFSNFCSPKCKHESEEKKRLEEKEKEDRKGIQRDREMQILQAQGVNSYEELVIKNLEEGKKSIVVAMFLNLFLGFFGVHWFYLGNKKKGKLYLFTFGLLVVYN